MHTQYKQLHAKANGFLLVSQSLTLADEKPLRKLVKRYKKQAGTILWKKGAMTRQKATLG